MRSINVFIVVCSLFAVTASFSNEINLRPTFKKNIEILDERAPGSESRSKKYDTIEGYKVITQNNIVFKWKIEGEKIRIILKAPTDGWVAVGFNSAPKMNGADLIIGYVVNNNQVLISDDFGVGHTHMPDISQGGKDNIMDKLGWEKNGFTEIKFSRLLNTGDAKDMILQKGQKIALLLAYGTTKDFTSYHKVRTGLMIEL
ncbi:MAG: DOMON domain-containing protein [Candidatus Margulisbacteria bacterium]|nr:DOMON domain-containing protein [Candidatus Margulisiibacteriota bacterium]